jgi:hypothetical protein
MALKDGLSLRKSSRMTSKSVVALENSAERGKSGEILIGFPILFTKIHQKSLNNKVLDLLRL